MLSYLVQEEPLDKMDRLAVCPRSHYRRLRSFWALSRSTSKDLSLHEPSSLFRHPFVRTFQPSAALVRLLFPHEFSCREPLIQFPTGAALVETGAYAARDRLPFLPELCQLALLWVLAGEVEAAGRLIKWLLPLLDHSTLWTSEEAYDPQEFHCSASQLYSYLGNVEKATLHKEKSLQSGPVDPFFMVLQKEISSLPPFEKGVLAPVILDPHLGLWANSSIALTLSGQGTSLGAFQGHGVEVRAFGPQFYPLTDLGLFGIRGLHQAQHLDEVQMCGWTRCFAQPEVWLEVNFLSTALETRLATQWLGLTSEKKAAFAFYVKADTARVGDEIFRSKSLQRYKGSSDVVLFNDGAFAISCSMKRPLQLIPLAGEGCFWGSDFLLAFDMSPFDSVESFLFQSNLSPQM